MNSYLITGGAGAFGQAFVRRVLKMDARRVVVFSRSESRQAEMRASITDERVRYLIGDVRDLPRLMDACRGVETVVHAAALKRIEVCEGDPAEAVATNIMGTLNVTRACIERGVMDGVFLSSDKAASPNTHYGATKLAAERLWVGSNAYAGAGPTRFAATRYGNVLGSTGSVVPTWRKQKAAGEITITDLRCTRFWMSIDQAVDLVLLALREMRGGEVFVPKIQAMPVVSLARVIAPGCRIKLTGLRPGEKLHETLITEDEARRTYDCGGHYVIEPETRSWGDVSPLKHPLVPDGFVYRSDTADALPVEQALKAVAA